MMSAADEERRLGRAVRERARALGFDLVGVTRPDVTAHGDMYDAWLEASYHGGMGYLGRPEARARRRDLHQTVPGVRSVVVVGHAYGDGAPGPPLNDRGSGLIARYARGRDYHRVIVPRLRTLHRWIQEQVGRPVAGKAYADTGPILERDLGRRAGLGWFGRNTMLIHPRRGSYFFLGVLLLDLDLDPDPPFAADHCGSCRACLDACPTGALLGRDATGAPVMDARRCISYLTIEHRGPIPEELRPLLGNRVFGCDICQEVCPFTQRFDRQSDASDYAARGPGEPPSGVQPEPLRRDSAEPTGGPEDHPGTRSPSLVDLLRTALDPASWDAFSRGSPVRRAGRAGFARNVCVALGNWGDPAAAPILTTALADPDPLVREHAAWAMGRVRVHGDPPRSDA